MKSILCAVAMAFFMSVAAAGDAVEDVVVEKSAAEKDAEKVIATEWTPEEDAEFLGFMYEQYLASANFARVTVDKTDNPIVKYALSDIASRNEKMAKSLDKLMKKEKLAKPEAIKARVDNMIASVMAEVLTDPEAKDQGFLFVMQMGRHQKTIGNMALDAMERTGDDAIRKAARRIVIAATNEITQAKRLPNDIKEDRKIQEAIVKSNAVDTAPPNPELP